MLSNLLKACTACFVIAAAGSTFAAARETTAPDILLISGDDLGAHLGCYGDPVAKTPHMDRIANEGMRFDNAWVTQASCSPSRSSIMTGLYPHQNGQIGLAHLGFQMDREWPTIPSLLNKAGYFTGLLNKLHIKPESAFPFQYIWNGKGASNRSPVEIAKRVDEFLSKAGDKPVFLHASFSDPHRPFIKQVDGSPQAVLTEKDVKMLPFMEGLEDVPDLKEEVAGYYNCINRMDDCVGVVLEKLEKAGRLDNTLIILIGDHGAPFGRGKVTCYNPGLRIPFLIRWPGVSKPGASSTALISTIDILPTILDAAGAKYEGEIPGYSLRASSADPMQSPREFMFAEFTAHLPADYYPRRTVRTRYYQLIHNLMGGQKNPTPGIEGKAEREAFAETDAGTSRARTAIQTYVNPPEIELYDLEKDPDCFVNIAGTSEEYKQVQAEMAAELMQWREETKDPLLKEGELERLGQEIKSRLNTKFSGTEEDTTATKKAGRRKR